MKIYCITDINGLCYVGKTKQSLNKRLRDHRSDKNRNKGLTSSKLDLYNCEIFILEECNNDISKERERYWINNIDCVNEYKLNYDNKIGCKNRYYRNRKLELKKKKEHYYYVNSWGGHPDYYNNLLSINLN